MPKKKGHQQKTIANRRAHYDYELGDQLVAGLELTGREAKSLRLGHGQLQGAYVTVKNNQLWLINAAVIGSSGIPIAESERTRARRLLAKRHEIDTLIEARRQGRSIVPLEILAHGHYIKLRLAIGKGKKHYDKRQVLKKREESRHIAAAMKQR